MWNEFPDFQLPEPRTAAASYAKARPFPHISFDDFLPDAFARQLLHDFPAFDRTRALDENGQPNLRVTNESVQAMSPAYARLETFLSSPRFLAWLSEVTGIPHLLFDPTHYGGGTHENLSGQELAPHVDFNMHPQTGWYRRLNLLLYLNPEWQESWGGNLNLHRDPWQLRAQDQVVRITPAWNRLAVFTTSDVSWHGFEKIRGHEGLSRKSFAAYFYTKEPPPHGLRFHHSTIYCERPIPESVKAGAVLSAADHAEILRLTARRDQLLQSLYERELQFSETCQLQIEARRSLERDAANSILAAARLEQDNIELLGAFHKKTKAMEADHADLLAAFHAKVASLEKDKDELASKLTEKIAAADQDQAALLRAFREKVSYLEKLLQPGTRRKNEPMLTLLPSGSNSFVVANGTCKQAKLWSGCEVLVEQNIDHGLERGDCLLVSLRYILPNSAEEGQYTLVQFLGSLGDRILTRSFGEKGKLHILPGSLSVGRAKRSIDWFAAEQTLAIALELTAEQKILETFAASLNWFDSYLGGVYRKALARLGLCFHFEPRV